MARADRNRRLRIVGTDGQPPHVDRQALRQAAWQAHQEALTIGGRICRHHVAAAALRDGKSEACVQDYRAELARARAVIDRLDSRLAALESADD